MTAEDEPVAPGVICTFAGESEASAGGEEARVVVQVIVIQMRIDTVIRIPAAWLACGTEKRPHTKARTRSTRMDSRRMIGILSSPGNSFKKPDYS
ncbi:unannotated protein [freshwater metagenome]|uniref:Unannotated protein n=1 Tax=freshwater metagenome TaxID=449393 RepID=A0A6J7BCJ0_9ZZZZ